MALALCRTHAACHSFQTLIYPCNVQATTASPHEIKKACLFISKSQAESDWVFTGPGQLVLSLHRPAADATPARLAYYSQLYLWSLQLLVQRGKAE